MTASSRALWQPWTGLFVGALAWYGAHDLSFYLLRPDCSHPWIVPVIHVVALGLALTAGLFSWISPRSPGLTAAPWVGVGAAALFALVIVWQGTAGFIYSGCER